jgi:hypothetical protein
MTCATSSTAEGNRSFRIFVALAACAATTALARPSGAQTDAAASEALFREGMALFDAGDYAQACPKLADSHKLDPAGGTLFALALCHEREGKTATAWAEYIDAAGFARREGRTEREEAARQRASELEPRLSRLTIRFAPDVRDPATISVRRNGDVVPGGALGTALPVDPGTHTIEATAPAKQPFATKVEVARDGDAKIVEIPVLADAEGSAEDAAGGGGPFVPPPAEPRSGGSAQKTVGWILVGTGVAALGVGAFFGLRAMSQADESRELCPTSRCNSADAIALNDDAKTSAMLSNVLFGAGVLAAGAGVALVLTSPSRGAPSHALGPPLVRVGVGPGSFALTGAF